MSFLTSRTEGALLLNVKFFLIGLLNVKLQMTMVPNES